ncbi:MAG: SH3 domain-containing protein [Treponema sp.]|nr:SH3 domain-containing protein [Treponema sp.]
MRFFFKFFLVLSMMVVLCTSCVRRLGWGVLLWSNEDPAIPAGTVLSVFVKSNINKVWIAGIPEEYLKDEDAVDKFEIPFVRLELFSSKRAAEKWAKEFAPFAVTYATTLQDGLPIRDGTDNNARRVYRLKKGEVVKIIAQSEGTPAISGTGDPLPGNWYHVLTENGTFGYCFSYRLKLFDYAGGFMEIAQIEEEEEEDTELETVLSKKWYPESYKQMVDSEKIDLDMLSQRWGFYPGEDSGTARVFLKDIENDIIIDKTFKYTGIKKIGSRIWTFEGATLQMELRPTTLAVQYSEKGSAFRTWLFVNLASDVDDIILKENARRSSLFRRIYDKGPVFSSANYGTLTFNPNGSFVWTGFDMLTPAIIPSSVSGTGRVVIRLFLPDSLKSQYDGALSLAFNGAKNPVNFLYKLENQGFRIEYVPPSNIEEVTVTHRDASPTVIYFFRGNVGGE